MKKIFGGLGFFVLVMMCTQVFASGIDQVSVRFCDNGIESLSMSGLIFSPGDNYELCFSAKNNSDEEQTIGFNFVDGQANTIDATKVGCLREDQQDNFGQYVTGYPKLVTIPAKTTEQFVANINLPISQAGRVLGCLTVLDEKSIKAMKDTNGGVSTIIRKGHTIEAYVDHQVDVGLELEKPINPGVDIVASTKVANVSKAGELYTAAVGVENIGDLDQSVTVEGVVTDTFGAQQMLEIRTGTVTPKEVKTVMLDQIETKRYKLRYTVDMKVTHHAVSEFRSEFITDEMLQDHVKKVSLTFFLFPWWLVIALGGLIVLIWLLMMISKRAKKRRVYQRELEKKIEQLTH